MRRRLVLLSLMSLLACSESDPMSGPGPCISADCGVRSLPMSDAADAPALIEAALECQSHAVVALVTVTDPQGTDDLLTVQQSVGVATNDNCSGTPILLQDDLAGSGLEESFGDAVRADTMPGLYEAICGCTEWAIQVELSDLEGNTTSGWVAARVTVP
jgi:hypothetical protein